MLPDLRFAVGAVLAGMLLIVTAFGLAATVRVAHHTAAGQGDTLRMLVNADPFDWGYLAAEPRHVATIKPEVAAADDRAVLEGLPVTAPDTNAAPAVGPDATAAEVALPDADTAAVTAPDIDVTASIGARDRKPPLDAKIVIPGEEVAALDQPPLTRDLTPSTAPVETSAAPFDVEKPNGRTEPLEATERISRLPAFPTAGHGFVPPYPIARPAPEAEAKPRANPDAKPAAKPDAKPAIKRKKKAARKRQRAPPAAVSPPVATPGFPVSGYDKWWSVD